MKIDHETNSVPKYKSDPWWTYLVYAGSNVLGKVLSTRISMDGNDGRAKQKPLRGAKVSRGEQLKPGVDPERISATTIIGERIMGSDGKTLGRVQEVAIDLTTSYIPYLILSAGGVLGLGDKFYAIPLDSLTFDPVEKVFHLNIDKKRLKQIPDFDKHHWPKKARWPPVLAK